MNVGFEANRRQTTPTATDNRRDAEGAEKSNRKTTARSGCAMKGEPRAGADAR